MAGTLARLARHANRVLPLGWRVINIGGPLAQIARAGPAYAYLTPESAMVTLHDGHLLYVDPRDQSVSAHLIARGVWEMWVERTVKALVKPGDRVVEVGANVGYFTVMMAAIVGEGGHITAFEANPHLAELVRRSLLLNGYAGRATLRAEAASDRVGAVEFLTAPTMNGGGHIGLEGEGATGEVIAIRAPAVTLDGECAYEPADVLRMDAEGAEPLVLRGAEQFLANSPNLRIIMEWDVTQIGSRCAPGDTVDLLTRHGFRFWRIEKDATLTAVASGALPTLPHSDLVLCRAASPWRD